MAAILQVLIELQLLVSATKVVTLQPESQMFRKTTKFGSKSGSTTPQSTDLATVLAMKQLVSSSMTPQKSVWTQMASTLTTWRGEVQIGKILGASTP